MRPLAALAAVVLSLTASSSVFAATPAPSVATPVSTPPCTLTATVDPGRSIALEGRGFAAGAGVTIDVLRDGDAQPSIRVTVDASGAFTATIDAGPGRGGAYSFSATDGTCRASTTAVAVETAGGGGGTAPGGGSGSGGASGATLPPTDTAALTVGSGASDGAAALAEALLLLAAGAALAVVALAAIALGRGRRTVRGR